MFRSSKLSHSDPISHLKQELPSVDVNILESYIFMSIQLAAYIALLAVWLPLLWCVTKMRGIYAAPLYTTMVFSMFLFNIVGSIVVFVPSLNMYGMKEIYSDDFFYIHLIIYIYDPLYILALAFPRIQHFCIFLIVYKFYLLFHFHRIEYIPKMNKWNVKYIEYLKHLYAFL